MTLSFDEGVKGWTSRYSYAPKQMFSIQNNFFSTNSGNIYQHYSTNVNRANFYGVQYISSVKTIFNKNPSLVKSFQTVNYEGGGNWSMASLTTNEDSANLISPFVMPTTLVEMQNNLLKNQFKAKEDKFFANLINTSLFTQGEVVFGKSISGVKGFFATVEMTATNTGISGTNELFSVSLEFNESSY